MKKITFLLVSLLLWGHLPLMAQWKVGGNTLSSNGRFGTNNSYAVIFETNDKARGIVTNTGNWGIGTTSPSAKLHIKSSKTLIARFTNSAGTTGKQTALIDIQNGAGVLWRYGVGGAGNGLGLIDGQFYIEHFGVGSVLTLTKGANVGIGTIAPGGYKLKVTHSTFGFNIENATTLDDWEFWSNSGGLSLYANSAFRGNFNPTTGAYSSVSDERLKTNIQSMPSILEKINQLKPSTYQYKADSNIEAKKGDIESYGFLAQDVMKIFPHLVTHIEDKARGLDVYTMDYSGYGVIAIKGIQELLQNMQEQQKTISTLENRVAQLETALKAASHNNMGSQELTGSLLEQNHPNPFDQATTIAYQAPAQAQQVSLLITNLQGVTVLQFDDLAPGAGKVEVAAGSLAAGTYVYTLVVDGKPLASQKMILTK